MTRRRRPPTLGNGGSSLRGCGGKPGSPADTPDAWRHEVSNNSYAKGLVQMLANDTIGTGPQLQMLSGDEDFNDRVETQFMRWADAVHLPSKLRTMRMARCQNGGLIE